MAFSAVWSASVLLWGALVLISKSQVQAQGHATRHPLEAAPPPLVFFHISKTAGSATLKALKDSTLEPRVLSEDEKKDTKLGWLNTTRPGQFVWHHSPAFSCDTDWCWSQPHVWFTIWRDPIDRIISQYFYVRHSDRGVRKESSRARHLELDRGIVACVRVQAEGCRRNWMTAMMCGHAPYCNYRVFNTDDVLAQRAISTAESNLARFGFVLRQESLSNDLRVMLHKVLPGTDAIVSPEKVRVTGPGTKATQEDLKLPTAADGSCPRWFTRRSFCESQQSGARPNQTVAHTSCISIDHCRSLIKKDPVILGVLRAANQLDIQLTTLAMKRNAELSDHVIQPHVSTSTQCQPGSMSLPFSRYGPATGEMCIRCPVGTFRGATDSRCLPCPINTAQPREGSTSCNICEGMPAINADATLVGEMRWLIGRAFCPNTTDWAVETSLPVINCSAIANTDNPMKIPHITHVKSMSRGTLNGRSVAINRLKNSDHSRLKGFSAGFARAAQMAALHTSMFPSVVAVCNDDPDMPGYVTEMLENSTSISNAGKVLSAMNTVDSLAIALSAARQYGTALLHMSSGSSRWPSLVGRRIVYCDHQKTHILLLPENGRLVLIDLDDAPIVRDGEEHVGCNPGPDTGQVYKRNDSMYTSKRDAFKFCYFAQLLFFNGVHDDDAARDFVPPNIATSLRNIFNLCWEPIDALRPSLEMVVASITDVALLSGKVPLIHMHVQLSGGSEVGKILSRARPNTSIRLAGKKRSVPWFGGRSSWGWPCGLHPPLNHFRECLATKYNLVDGRFDFSWLFVIRNPLDRVVSEYVECCERKFCSDTTCLNSTSISDFVFQRGASHYQRQLWMLSGGTKHDCATDPADCLRAAKSNLDNAVFIVYEDFDNGIRHLERVLGLQLPVYKRRVNARLARLVSDIDPVQFSRHYSEELDLYDYAVRRFSMLQSPSFAPLPFLV